MDLSWLECLIYGLISGFTEFLPVSSVAHQTLYLKILGEEPVPVLQFSGYLGCIAALLTVFMPDLLRLRRERRLASVPKNRRRRQPDFGILMESKVLRMATLTVLVLFAGYSLVYQLYQRLWIMAILMAINGIVLFVPPYFPSANKSARSLSSLDALCIGLAAGAGMIPGISRVGCAISAAGLRGADRQYAADLSLLMSIPALAVLAVIGMVASLGTVAFSAAIVLCCVSTAVAAFVSGYFGIYFMRFLAHRVGYSGFAYYCWGAALFTLLIYLI